MPWVHCHAGTGSHLLIPLKGNFAVTTYNDILHNLVLPSLWQKFGEDPRTGVMVRCSKTFGHIAKS